MGYTHYWRREDTTIDPEVWTGFATEVTAIINDAIRHDIAIAGPLGDGDAQIDTELVAFNGRSPDDYESFVITRAANLTTPRNGLALMMWEQKGSGGTSRTGWAAAQGCGRVARGAADRSQRTPGGRGSSANMHGHTWH